MFRGAAAVNLDAKGRVAIPTRYRAEIMEKNQGQMVCTVDIRQPCLLLYPLDEWEKSNKNYFHFLTLTQINAAYNVLCSVMPQNVKWMRKVVSY